LRHLLARKPREEIGEVGVRDVWAEGVVLREEDEVGALVAGVPDGPDVFFFSFGGVFIIILSRVG
jgi:hypothetical protein